MISSRIAGGGWVFALQIKSHGLNLLGIVYATLYLCRPIIHTNPLLRAGPSTKRVADEPCSILCLCKAQRAALAFCADAAPVELDDPMAEQIGAGFYGIASGDVAGRVDSLQVHSGG